jgi:hypothetical protein
MAKLTLSVLFGLALAFQAQAQDSAKDVPIPPKKPPPANDSNAPTVTIRSTATGDRVEEYRQNGKVFMVKVTPKKGVPYTLYDDDKDGRLDRSDAEKNDVSPVYYTLYEWGNRTGVPATKKK